VRDYKKIRAYQLASALVFEIYKLTKKFPPEEMYGFTSQLRRAALSVAANIAEGASRKHKKGYLQFLYIARGSVSEVECLLSLATQLGYLQGNESPEICNRRDEVARTLFGLICSVEGETQRS